MFAPSRYTRPPALVDRVGDLAHLRLEDADRVRVGDHEHGDLVVEMAAEVVHVDACRPACVFTVTVSKPAIVALAGFVPWALSGTSTLVRFSPRSRKYAAATQSAVSSPCAPAAGCSEHAGRPEISCQILLQLVQQLQHALQRFFRLIRMQIGEARHAGDAARSASGCTSSCRSRADRNAYRRSC